MHHNKVKWDDEKPICCEERRTGDGSPISSSLSSLKKLVFKALTKNQILLIHEIHKNFTLSVTSLVNEIPETSKIPLSTLKLNARLLRELGLVKYSNFGTVELAEGGNFVLSLMDEPESVVI